MVSSATLTTRRRRTSSAMQCTTQSTLQKLKGRLLGNVGALNCASPYGSNSGSGDRSPSRPLRSLLPSPQHFSPPPNLLAAGKANKSHASSSDRLVFALPHHLFHACLFVKHQDQDGGLNFSELLGMLRRMGMRGTQNAMTTELEYIRSLKVRHTVRNKQQMAVSYERKCHKRDTLLYDEEIL